MPSLRAHGSATYFRLSFGFKRRRHHHDALNRPCALANIGRNGFEIIDSAEHGNAAYRLTTIGRRVAIECRPGIPA